MQVRIECTVPGLEGNWVQLAEVWTRAELRDWTLAVFGALPQKQMFEILERKLAGVHVYLPDGTLVTDARTLVERFDELDMRLAKWLASGVSQALEELQALGKARKRLLFDGVEVAARIEMTPMKMTPQTPARN